MKKAYILLIASLFLIPIAGCKKADTLTCTSNGDEYVMTFKNNKVSKYKTIETLSSPEEATVYLAIYNEHKEKNRKVEKNGSKIEITITVDDETELVDSLKGTKEEIKKRFTDDGWKCE